MGVIHGGKQHKGGKIKTGRVKSESGGKGWDY